MTVEYISNERVKERQKEREKVRAKQDMKRARFFLSSYLKIGSYLR